MQELHVVLKVMYPLFFICRETARWMVHIRRGVWEVEPVDQRYGGRDEGWLRTQSYTGGEKYTAGETECMYMGLLFSTLHLSV